MSEAPPATAPAAPAPPARPKRRRGLWIALLASLAVNLFLVGWVASSWVYGPRMGLFARGIAPPTVGMAFLHRRALHALSGDERQTADRLWREGFADTRERLRALRQAHLELRSAYVADQADAKQLADAVAKFKTRADAVFEAVNATLIKIATALPAESRKAYFNAGFPRRRERGRNRSPERRTQ
jgi:uncharacterized membrane protein